MHNQMAIVADFQCASRPEIQMPGTSLRLQGFVYEPVEGASASREVAGISQEANVTYLARMTRACFL